MRLSVPATAEEALEQARYILTRAGFKIFTPAWKYSKLSPAFLAVRPEAAAKKFDKSACLVKIRNNKLLVSWLQPDKHDKAVTKEFEDRFGQFIAKTKGMLFRIEDWDTLYHTVISSQQSEFKEQIYGTRLS